MALPPREHIISGLKILTKESCHQLGSIERNHPRRWSEIAGCLSSDGYVEVRNTCRQGAPCLSDLLSIKLTSNICEEEKIEKQTMSGTGSVICHRTGFQKLNILPQIFFSQAFKEAVVVALIKRGRNLKS